MMRVEAGMGDMRRRVISRICVRTAWHPIFVADHMAEHMAEVLEIVEVMGVRQRTPCKMCGLGYS